MNRLVKVLLAALIGLSVVGCTAKQETPAPTPEATAETTPEETAAPTVATAADYEGNWQDKTSQRATMTIESVGMQKLEVRIHWPSSADEYTAWTFQAPVDEETGEIKYEDGKKVTVKMVDGKEVEEPAENLCTGKIYIAEDGLHWEDDDELEQTKDCVFEKLPE
ncbi:MAG: hypothetical protein HUJ57_01555 [Erysipelotrichaceae bacterium]|nr:hypothetical protein [Erysipelotrichaceae bacterium]